MIEQADFDQESRGIRRFEDRQKGVAKVGSKRYDWLEKQFGSFERATEMFQEAGLEMTPIQIDAVAKVFTHNHVPNQGQFSNMEQSDSNPQNPYYILRELANAYKYQSEKEIQHRLSQYPPIEGRYPQMDDWIPSRPGHKSGSELAGDSWAQEKGNAESITHENEQK